MKRYPEFGLVYGTMVNISLPKKLRMIARKGFMNLRYRQQNMLFLKLELEILQEWHCQSYENEFFMNGYLTPVMK